VLAEFLQPLVLSDLLLERAVKVRVLGGDADIVGKSEKQFDVIARKKFARFGSAYAQESDGPATHGAGQVIIEVQIGYGLPHRGRPASGDRVQMIAGTLEKDRWGAPGPVEKTQIERIGRVEWPRARSNRHAEPSFGGSG